MDSELTRLPQFNDKEDLLRKRAYYFHGLDIQEITPSVI